MEQGLTLLFRNPTFAEQSLLFQKRGFAETPDVRPNIDEDQAKTLLLTSCNQEVGEGPAQVLPKPSRRVVRFAADFSPDLRE